MLVLFVVSLLFSSLFFLLARKKKERKKERYYRREIVRLEAVLKKEIGNCLSKLTISYPYPKSEPEMEKFLDYVQNEGRVNVHKLHYTYNRLRHTRFLAQE